jgi:hypothetical protein
MTKKGINPSFYWFMTLLWIVGVRHEYAKRRQAEAQLAACRQSRDG